jgi:hypothetical protein
MCKENLPNISVARHIHYISFTVCHPPFFVVGTRRPGGTYQITYMDETIDDYSFPLGLPELSLFPTTASRRWFSIVVKAIEETP